MNQLLQDNEHNKIRKKLDTFIESGKIPHIIFFGTHGSGKRTCLNYLIDKVYESIENRNEYIIQINCCQFKVSNIYGKTLNFSVRNKFIIIKVKYLNRSYSSMQNF